MGLLILFLPTSLQQHQAQTGKDGVSSYKIEYVAQAEGILNLNSYHNCIVGSKVTVILLNGWILHRKGSVRRLQSTLFLQFISSFSKYKTWERLSLN